MRDLNNSGEPAVLERAKNIDHAPDITSDEYWDTHHIAVVRVADAAPAERDRREVRHRIEQTITEAPIDAKRATPLMRLPLGERFEGRPRVTPGDAFVVFYLREGEVPVAAIPLDTSPEQSELVNRLEKIARLRAGDGGSPALMEAAFDPDRDVALYALKRLEKQQGLTVNQGFLDRLHALRDADRADPEIRMRAANLLVSSGAMDREEQYTWLKGTLTNAQVHDWVQLRAFALRMLEFADKRAETAELLTQIVKDSALSQQVRIAAYSVFEDPRLFTGDRRDVISNLIFQTVEWMQRSTEEFLRPAAAMLLHNLTFKVPVEDRALYSSRAQAALRSALAAAPDAGTEQTIKHSLEMLQQRREPE